ncbi:sensor histidine kinase NtrY-like [Swaminathania salitolerans]|uniref:histidine kinase n=1 Tax=Swaminathania salitolerans TaxID=182838 RepID=A0A511BSH7_9PROT|nr:PAS domain-containing sensor histidine kinase [Swaminathania salitolerans]GEL02554.1 PAS domain-containing sensor histidine kinase [Swaminathania salitolerans]
MTSDVSSATGLRSLFRRLVRRVSRLKTAMILICAALVLVFTTFVVLAGGLSLAYRPQIEAIVFLLDFLVLMLLGAAVIIRVGRMLAERRTGLAGARLHVRLITLFGVVAVAPTVIIGALAALFFHFGIQIWFSNRVNTALTEARDVAAGYLQEHNDNIRTEAFALANIIITAENDEMYRHGIDLMREPAQLSMMLDVEATERGLNEAVVFDSYTNKVVASGGLAALQGKQLALPPKDATTLARTNDVAILDSPDEKTVRAVVSLGPSSGLMLVITRPVDAKILEHMHHTDAVVSEYQRLNAHRSAIQISFVLIFALLGMLVLSVGMLTGLVLANQITQPLGLLILAARRVSEGDLSVRVPEARGRNSFRDDEVGTLSRAFNRMTDQLSTQRKELMVAYEQIDERRRFTETVLSGVSAGVIGLDPAQRVELPNRAASRLLQRDLESCGGEPLRDLVPEFAQMLDLARVEPGQAHTAEIQIDAPEKAGVLGDGPSVGTSGRTLLVRVVGEQGSDTAPGYVVTFDDITALLAAQRKAAWADVARRIAHEIKNPLTPIQLSAERLKRRFLREIGSDPETFSQCVDTIVRHVGDIGRMVDEFSSFARMPQPVLRDEDLSRLVREALVLQRNAHPEIVYVTEGLPAQGPVVRCDRRLMGQALTNLLQNAADAIAMRARETEGDPGPDTGEGESAETLGRILVSLVIQGEEAVVQVIDDGIGLPSIDRHRLTEPYITHKPKGTGLGLAIVKKIMEDHAGGIRLEDRPDGRGTVSTLTLPVREHVAGQGTGRSAGQAVGRTDADERQ